MYDFRENDLEQELSQVDQELNELQERKNLLSKVFNQKEVEFKTIRSITLIKKIHDTVIDEEFGEMPEQKRLYFEVLTDQSSFMIMSDYLGIKHTAEIESLHFYDEIHRLHLPKMSVANVTILEPHVRKVLEGAKESDDFDLQILHMYNNEPKDRVFTQEEMEKHKMTVEKIKEDQKIGMLEFERFLSDLK